MEMFKPHNTIPETNFQYFFPYISNSAYDTVQVKPDPSTNPRIFEVEISTNAPQITIKIEPFEAVLNAGNSLEISFLPGEQCVFGDGHACIYSFLSSNGSRIKFASVHSGLGGEAEDFRDLIEGTGLKRGLYRSDQVYTNAQALIGSDITLIQGEREIRGLRLVSIIRIPPQAFSTYMALPIEQTLDYAVRTADLDPELLNQDLFVFETCGWRLPDEDQVSGLEDTSSSIYLAFVGLVEH